MNMDGRDAVLEALIVRHSELEPCRKDLQEAVEMLCESFASGNKLLVCGNGGSAADSEHIVGELMKSFKLERALDADFADEYRRLFGEDAPSCLEGALPAVSLPSHISLSTAFANDKDGEGTFAQQVLGLGRKGDVLLAISTSGNSGNVVMAAKVAKARGMKVIGLTGANTSRLSGVADVTIAVPEVETYLVQELHLPVYHAICASVEQAFFG